MTSNWPVALKRNQDQVKVIQDKLGLFRQTFIATENDLDGEYWGLFRPFVKDHGYAYWTWKPYMILKRLEQVKEGDFLLYLDGGCSFPMERLDEWSKKLHEKCDEMISSGSYIALSSHCKLPLFTVIRTETQDFFNLQGNTDFIEKYPHWWAGGMLLRKCPQSVALVQTWYNFFVLNYEKVNIDYLDKTGQVDEYLHNDLDQGVFCCICYSNKVNITECKDLFADFKMIKRWRG